MSLAVVQFSSLIFAVLALLPAGAHVLELPNKMRLDKTDYLSVQQIYRGRVLAGIVVVGALISTAILAAMVRNEPSVFPLAVIALPCIVGTQAVFWSFTAPANRATANWTMLPENWRALRARWEYSHAAAAVLNFLAVIALISSVLRAS